MRKISGILCLVLFLTAALGFGQETPAVQPAQQESQPLIFQLFGTFWLPLSGEILASLDDLGVKVAIIWARDMDGTAGIAGLLIILREGLNDYKYKIVGGWIQPYSSDEQGFYLKESGKLSDLMKKKGEAGEELEWRGREDKDGNPILEFYLAKKDGSEEVLRVVDIKKFVEENFKDQD